FSSRRRHTRFSRDWSSDVCSSDLRSNQWNNARHEHRHYRKPGAIFFTDYVLSGYSRPVPMEVIQQQLQDLSDHLLVPLPERTLKIGRASCRERVKIEVGAGAWKNK